MRCDPVQDCRPFHPVSFPSLISLTRSLGGGGWGAVTKRGCSPVKAKAAPKSKGPINFERHKICWQRHKNSHSGSWRLETGDCTRTPSPQHPFGPTVLLYSTVPSNRSVPFPFPHSVRINA